MIPQRRSMYRNFDPFDKKHEEEFFKLAGKAGRISRVARSSPVPSRAIPAHVDHRRSPGNLNKPSRARDPQVQTKESKAERVDTAADRIHKGFGTDEHKKTLEDFFKQELTGTLDEGVQQATNAVKSAAKDLIKDRTEEVVEDTAMHKYSRLANASYTHFNEGADAANAELQDPRYNYIKDLKDFKIDPELSTPDDAVLHNPVTGEAVVSYRGTVTIPDWYTNAKIAMTPQAAQGSTRFKNAENVMQATIDKYGKENIKSTGHSQGGGVSSHTGQKFDVESHSFSPAFSLRQAAQNRKGKYAHNTSTAYAYRPDWDGVSVNANLPSIRKNFNITTVNTVPGSDEDPIKVHGLGDNYAPEIVEDMGNGAVKVVRNTKFTSLKTGLRGFLSAAGIVAAAAETGVDVKEDVTDPDTMADEKVHDVGLDVAKNAAEFKAGGYAFENLENLPFGNSLKNEAGVVEETSMLSSTRGLSLVAADAAYTVAEDFTAAIKGKKRKHKDTYFGRGAALADGEGFFDFLLGRKKDYSGYVEAPRSAPKPKYTTVTGVHAPAPPGAGPIMYYDEFLENNNL